MALDSHLFLFRLYQATGLTCRDPFFFFHCSRFLSAFPSASFGRRIFRKIVNNSVGLRRSREPTQSRNVAQGFPFARSLLFHRNINIPGGKVTRGRKKSRLRGKQGNIDVISPTETFPLDHGCSTPKASPRFRGAPLEKLSWPGVIFRHVELLHFPRPPYDNGGSFRTTDSPDYFHCL